MNPEILDKIIKAKRKEIVVEFFDKNDIECIWDGVLRMSLNGLHFTWHTDFSGIEFDAFRTENADDKTKIKLDKHFKGQRINDFDNLVKLIKTCKTMHASRALSSMNRKTGVFEQVKKFNEF